MSGTECGARKDTGFGFDAVCCREAGGHEVHASADFLWVDDQARASVRFTPAFSPAVTPAEWLSPVCPWCFHPPRMLISQTQAMCSNVTCRALVWDPTRDMASQLEDAHEVTLVREAGDE